MLEFTDPEMLFFFFRNWIIKLSSEENQIFRAMFKARKLAGSATYKQSKTIPLSPLIIYSWKLHIAPLIEPLRWTWWAKIRNNIAKDYYVDIRSMAVQSYVFVETADHLLLTPSWATELLFFFFGHCVCHHVLVIELSASVATDPAGRGSDLCFVTFACLPANQSHTASSID